MKIKLADGDVIEERRNGNKLKLSTGDYIKITCVVSALILGGFTSWFTLKAEVNATAKEIPKIDCNTAANIKQDKDIVSIQGDLNYIKIDVADIKQEIKAQRTLLMDIRDRLPR